MESGNSTDEIEVDLRLYVLKPLQATWLLSLYNHLTGSMGKRHIAKGWKNKRVGNYECPHLLRGRQPYRPNIHLKV